jgi:hypothetical protein
MERTDDQIRSSIDTNEGLAEWGGWFIILGLVSEIILTLAFPGTKSIIENWRPVFATALIAAGVYAEIHFGGRAGRDRRDLQTRTDAKLAEALDRASRAEQELIDLKPPVESFLTGTRRPSQPLWACSVEFFLTLVWVPMMAKCKISFGTLNPLSGQPDGSRLTGYIQGGSQEK